MGVCRVRYSTDPVNANIALLLSYTEYRLNVGLNIDVSHSDDLYSVASCL